MNYKAEFETILVSVTRTVKFVLHIKHQRWRLAYTVSSVPWYNHWFRVSKFIPQRLSNSPASPITIQICGLLP